MRKIADLVHREVLEETGVRVRIVRPFALYSSPEQFTIRYPDGNEVHSFVLGVECRKIRGQERSQDDDSIGARWFDLNALPTNLMPMQYELIEDAIVNQAFLLK